MGENRHLKDWQRNPEAHPSVVWLVNLLKLIFVLALYAGQGWDLV